MGPRLGRVEYDEFRPSRNRPNRASMGPRLGRVEYSPTSPPGTQTGVLQWGHA